MNGISTVTGAKIHCTGVISFLGGDEWGVDHLLKPPKAFLSVKGFCGIGGGKRGICFIYQKFLGYLWLFL